MFYSSVALSTLLVGASAFAPITPPRRFGGAAVMMEVDAWNAEAQGTNYIDMATLE